MSKIKYNSTLYGFDIETTTTADGVTTHYLSNFQSVDFDMRNENRDDIIQSISDPVFCRSSSDVDNYLYRLNENSKDNDEHTIIFIHNLSYEFDYLIKNITFVREHYNKDNTLFLKSRIPVIMRLDFLEFRCSYKLLNKSLAKLGENLGFPKLDIDYKKQYFEFSQLPQIEYEYNKRDVQLMLLAVLKECNNWKYIEDVGDIPITSTGLTRKNNIDINTKKDRNIWAGMCAYQQDFSVEHIQFLESVYSGGYTHANAFYTGIPLHNVCSIDIVSSYPHSILHRNYPRYFKEYKGKHKINFLKFCISYNQGTYKDVINNYFTPFQKSFICSIKLKNVKAKILKNNNLILPISYSKCVDIIGCKLDNGRVFKARELTINCNEVDYFIYEQFYNFELVDCFQLYYTNYHRELPKYVTNSVRTYLHEKSTLKRVVKTVEDKEPITKDLFYNDKINGYIFADEQIDSILQLDSKTQEQVINDNYRASKNKLNAQYGINVQKLLTPLIWYNLETDECVTEPAEEITTKRLYRDFTVGLYVTAYSRLTLFMFALYLIDNTDTSLIYSDTDSWKCWNDLEGVKKAVTDYNTMIESIVINSNDYNIGYFDYESEYNYFCTLGCKKYIVADNQEVYATIAGLNKQKTTQALTDLYKAFDYDFNALCSVAFSPCTIFSASVTGKLVTKYNNDVYTKTVTDCNGDVGIISGRNMVELVDSDYILMDFYKPAINEYLNYCSDLQNRYIEILPTMIYKDGDTITYRYITDWKKEIKLLKTYNPQFENSVES